MRQRLIFTGQRNRVRTRCVSTCSGVTNGPFEGSATLTDDQAKALMGDQAYFNVHTAANPGGEVRQANLKDSRQALIHKPVRVPKFGYFAPWPFRCGGCGLVQRWRVSPAPNEQTTNAEEQVAVQLY